MYKECPICKKNYIDDVDFVGDNAKLSCKLCGQFLISNSDVAEENHIKESHYLMSAYLRREWELNKKATHIINSIINYEKNITVPDIDEQIDYLLSYIAKKEMNKGKLVILQPGLTYPLFFCKNANEMLFLIQSAQKLELLSYEPPYISIGDEPSYQLQCKLLYKGFARLGEIHKRNLESMKCFVAMSFEDKYDEVFEKGIKDTIHNDDDLKRKGLKVYRVDKDQNIQNNPTIINKIMSGIKQSRFVIADLSGHNHNVYFEIGYAMGFNIPVILICNEEDFQDEAKNIKIKFDLRGHSIIRYKSVDTLKEPLIDAIKANIY